MSDWRTGGYGRGRSNSRSASAFPLAATAPPEGAEDLWEEILQRFPKIEVVGEPKHVYSSFVHGITGLPVRIPA